MFSFKIEKEKIENFLEHLKNNYDEELTNGISKNNYDRAVRNFKAKFLKVISDEYKELILAKMQRTTKGHLVLGAETKREPLKVYFDSTTELHDVTYNFRYRVISEFELELFVEEHLVLKKDNYVIEK